MPCPLTGKWMWAASPASRIRPWRSWSTWRLEMKNAEDQVIECSRTPSLGKSSSRVCSSSRVGAYGN